LLRYTLCFDYAIDAAIRSLPPLHLPLFHAAIVSAYTAADLRYHCRAAAASQVTVVNMKVGNTQ